MTFQIYPMSQMQRVVIGVDPSGTSGSDDDRDSIGIIVAGKGNDGNYYVIADRTCKLSPDGWARQVITAYKEFSGDCIVAESNFGGAMVQSVIRTADRKAKIKMVTATRGKTVRAEPVSALYEQGKVFHSQHFPELEKQMLHMTISGYIGEGSPDRADALVWALSELAFTKPVAVAASGAYSVRR